MMIIRMSNHAYIFMYIHRIYDKHALSHLIHAYIHVLKDILYSVLNIY